MPIPSPSSESRPLDFIAWSPGQTPKIFVPIAAQPVITGLEGLEGHQFLEDHKSRWLTLAARLKPGETAAAAEAGINPLWSGFAQRNFRCSTKRRNASTRRSSTKRT